MPINGEVRGRRDEWGGRERDEGREEGHESETYRPFQSFRHYHTAPGSHPSRPPLTATIIITMSLAGRLHTPHTSLMSARCVPATVSAWLCTVHMHAPPVTPHCRHHHTLRHVQHHNDTPYNASLIREYIFLGRVPRLLSFH